MSHKNCPKRLKNRIFSAIFFIPILTFLVLFLLSDITYAQTSDQISLQGKIVRNDTGYEGLNVVEGTPSCVQSGADTCDFQVKYYSASTSGTLYLTETFSDVEIGDYGGVFNLKLGSGTVTTSAQCSDGTCNSIEEVFGEFKTIYLEIGFAPGGDGSFTETFTRTSLNASAFAMGAGSDSFSFYNTDDTGESSLNTVTGAVYYNTTDDELKVYNGSSWVSLATGSSSLWTEQDVGTDYSSYMSSAGIGTFDDFTLDLDDDRLSVHTAQMEGGFSVYSSYDQTGGTWPLVSFKADHSNYAGTILELTQDGSGDILQGYSGSTLSFQIDNSGNLHLASNGVAYFEPFSSLPVGGDLSPNTGEGCLYSYGGSLYWDPDCSASSPTALGGGTTLWTDDGTFTYLTSTSDDLVLGASTTTNAPFFFDVSEKRLGIGTGSPQAAIDIAGASSTISNTSGDITITPADQLALVGSMGLENTTSSTTGVIYKNGVRFIHNFEHPTGDTAIPDGKNTFIGEGAGNFVMGSTATETWNASYNIGIGYQALYDNTLGHNNVAIGSEALFSNTEGGGNVASGFRVLYSNTTGNANVASGNVTLYSNTTGTHNVAIGNAALYSNSTGTHNVASGAQALYYNTEGYYNVASGFFALFANTTGYGNVAIGGEALSGNTTGDSNVAIGTFAGYLTGGMTENDTSANSIFLGADTKAHSVGNENQIVIGYNASGLGSNTVVLGNDSIVTTALKGNVGIGTTNPTGLLTLAGDFHADANNSYDMGTSSTRWRNLYTQGQLDIGSDGDNGNIRYNTTDNRLEYSNDDGGTWVALSGVDRKVTLSAEYPGAVLAADGSSNTGSMTSDAEGSASNSMNYYEWSSSETTLQDYDVRIRFTLPDDFITWIPMGDITLNYVTEAASSTNNKVDMYVYEESSATVDASITDQYSSSAGVWDSATISGYDFSECDAAGETCVIILRMYSANDNYIRVGDIEINYQQGTYTPL